MQSSPWPMVFSSAEDFMLVTRWVQRGKPQLKAIRYSFADWFSLIFLLCFRVDGNPLDSPGKNISDVPNNSNWKTEMPWMLRLLFYLLTSQHCLPGRWCMDKYRPLHQRDNSPDTVDKVKDVSPILPKALGLFCPFQWGLSIAHLEMLLCSLWASSTELSSSSCFSISCAVFFSPIPAIKDFPVPCSSNILLSSLKITQASSSK